MTQAAHKIKEFPSTESPIEGLSEAFERHLDAYFQAHAKTPLLSGLYNILLREFERPLLIGTIKFASGNQTKAAEILGINRNTLKRKLDEHGIDPNSL